MLYVLFLIIAIGYNWRKFDKERDVFLSSLIEAKTEAHRKMILGHHFYIFIFEAFLAIIVADFISDRTISGGILRLGGVYLSLIFSGFFLYYFFIRYIEKHTQIELWHSFKTHVIKELRVNFAIIMLPILIYALINWTFQDGVYEEWGSLWFIGLLFNIIFVSVLTIVCSVIIMLRLIPNREITEPEYLEIINKHLAQINMPNMRIRWIETDIKNAFVVGLKLFRFSNQTMFIGKSLRTSLTLEEFDAVVAHELAHVANGHIHKRVIDLLKNFISIILGTGFLMLLMIGFSFLYWGEDVHLHTDATSLMCVVSCLAWIIFNYSLLFDTIRSHEYEADAYAVIKLGASLGALRSALEKLTNTEELPDYLKARTKKKGRKGPVGSWFARHFSTHPSLEMRMSSVQYKISAGLPFDHYISSAQKMRLWIGHLFNWKISVPLTTAFVITLTWGVWSFKEGNEAIVFIQKSSSSEIMERKDLISKINSRPQLIGQSLMFHVVKKQDPHLIDYFLENGANKGRTLLYISQLKDFSLFQRYYTLHQNELSEDEYFSILRKTAQMNFTEGYRFLVNGKRFEDMNPSYKMDVSRIHESSREPASAQE